MMTQPQRCFRHSLSTSIESVYTVELIVRQIEDLCALFCLVVVTLYSTEICTAYADVKRRNLETKGAEVQLHYSA
jgi:hypothetical protein